MWLKPSSPRLAVDCLGISETPPANPHGKEPPPQASTSSTSLQLPSFPERTRQTRVTAFLGMIPGHRGLAGISTARPPVWCELSPLRSTAQHGSNRIYSFPRVHGVSPSQPCQRPNQRRFETGWEMIGHKQRQPRSGMRLASSSCRPMGDVPAHMQAIVDKRAEDRGQEDKRTNSSNTNPGHTIVLVDVCHWGT